VVVGAGASKEADVFGEAPNIAARVQAAAEPGTVLITDAVHRLVSGLFVVESRKSSTPFGLQAELKSERQNGNSGLKRTFQLKSITNRRTVICGFGKTGPVT
jgi:class 3 adenylate cyclase